MHLLSGLYGLCGAKKLTFIIRGLLAKSWEFIFITASYPTQDVVCKFSASSQG